MDANPTKSQVLIARIAVVLLIALAVAGALWYGFSKEIHQRIWADIFNRPGGPMALRFVLQPVLGAIAAFHDGLKDARTGRSPYLWTILSSDAERGGRLREGMIATGRTILIGLVMDSIYQATVLKTFYPAEAVIVAILFAFVPYLLLRGPIARVARWRQGGTNPSLTETRK